MLQESAEPPGTGYNSISAPQTITFSSCIKAQLDARIGKLEQSTRYHQRRGRFYGRLHNITIMAVVFAGCIAFGVIEGNTLIVFGIGIAVLGALGVVLHFSNREEKHEKLFKRYNRLASEIRAEEQTRERLRRLSG